MLPKQSDIKINIFLKLKTKNNPQKVIQLGIPQREMEKNFERFPHLTKLIFSQLNNESLVKSKEVDKTWKNYINDQKLPWIRNW